MRGTPSFQPIGIEYRGIIPAYAGNTILMETLPTDRRDHPRVCGEHMPIGWKLAVSLGSSPRMRGTRWNLQYERRFLGIIPAYAGNTLRDYSNFVVSKFMSFVFHLV